MNKLLDKLTTEVSINTSGEAERFAKQCEQITDDFSVSFVYFCENNKEVKTTTELLQIFKTQYYE